MENLQATAPPLPQAANTGAPTNGPSVPDAASSATPTGFQILLAQQLVGLQPAPAISGDVGLDAVAKDDTSPDAVEPAAGAAGELGLLALLQLVPPLPPTTATAGNITGAAANDPATAITGAGAAIGDSRASGAELWASRAQASAVAQTGADLAANETMPAGAAGAIHDAGAGSSPPPAFMHNLQPAAGAATTPAAPVQMHVPTPLDHPAWGQALGQKLVWMVADKQHVAELHVNPPHLGPLDIKLTVDGNETTAVFTSPYAEVRQVLEAALPRLREVLADSGIMLGNASVTADSPRDQSSFSSPKQKFTGSSNGAQADEGEPARVAHPLRGRGMVDLFA